MSINNGNGTTTDPLAGRSARRRKADLAPAGSVRLPPHSPEAEAGVLGCCLLSPGETIRQARAALGQPGGQEFYDLRHRTIWLTMCALDDEAKGFDLITLQQRLKDHGHLPDVGGLSYLAALPDQVPSAANLAYYLDIVAEKFILRSIIAGCTEVATRAYEWHGELEPLLEEVRHDLVALVRSSPHREPVEELYVSPADIEEEHWQRWFGKARGVPGLPLPELAFGDFPFLIRLGELTYIDAETKMGKSTIASYIALHLIRQGLRVVDDSREIKRVETLKKMMNQLLGCSELPICQVGEKQINDADGDALKFQCDCLICKESKTTWAAAQSFFQTRLLINKRVGIKHWREIIDADYRLADDGWNFFIFDNFGKYGIPKDDYAQQSAFLDELAAFTKDTNSAAFLINHRNKSSEGDFRKKAAGAHEVLDAPDNLCSIVKNEAKWKKLFPYLDMLKADPPLISHEAFQSETKELREMWDAKFFVNAQRLDSTRSNAARELWFLYKAGQYFDHRQPLPKDPINWLARWTEEDQKAREKAKQRASVPLVPSVPSVPAEEP